MIFASHWIAPARTKADLGKLPRDKRWRRCHVDADARVERRLSNVLCALRLG